MVNPKPEVSGVNQTIDCHLRQNRGGKERRGKIPDTDMTNSGIKNSGSPIPKPSPTTASYHSDFLIFLRLEPRSKLQLGAEDMRAGDLRAAMLLSRVWFGAYVGFS